MATVAIRLSNSQQADVRVACADGAEALRTILAAVTANQVTIRSDKILAAITAGVRAENAGAVRRVLFGLATASRRRSVDVKDVLDGVTQTLRAQWPKTDLEKWIECRDALEALLRAESVVLATKAADLASDYDRSCLTSRILTDLRPVFDEPGDKIVGTVITHTLRMEYMTPEGEQHSVSVAMDMEDVRTLHDACTRAIKKANAAKLEADKQWKETWQPGEEWA